MRFFLYRNQLFSITNICRFTEYLHDQTTVSPITPFGLITRRVRAQLQLLPVPQVGALNVLCLIEVKHTAVKEIYIALLFNFQI